MDIPFVTRPRTALMLLSLVMATGCSSPTEPDKFPDPGHIIVRVLDTSARPVAGVLVQLWTADLTLVWRDGTTGADGRIEIGQAQGGVLPGDYVVKVQLPDGYALAAGQPASTPVSVRSRAQTSVVVTLTAP